MITCVASSSKFADERGKALAETTVHARDKTGPWPRTLCGLSTGGMVAFRAEPDEVTCASCAAELAGRRAT